MRPRHVLATALVAALAGLALGPVGASAGTIGGTNYAPQYDFSEFFAASDRKSFQVTLAGTAFPGVDPSTAARDLLPMLQAAKPRPALTFTLDKPNERARPDYRLVLVFDAANDLGSAAVCNGAVRTQPGKPGVLSIYAVYCRNDQALSEPTGWTPASGPSDPRVATLFKELMPVVFSDAPELKPQRGGSNRP